jgi:hypothetical protein
MKIKFKYDTYYLSKLKGELMRKIFSAAAISVCLTMGATSVDGGECSGSGRAEQAAERCGDQPCGQTAYAHAKDE